MSIYTNGSVGLDGGSNTAEVTFKKANPKVSDRMYYLTVIFYKGRERIKSRRALAYCISSYFYDFTCLLYDKVIKCANKNQYKLKQWWTTAVWAHVVNMRVPDSLKFLFTRNFGLPRRRRRRRRSEAEKKWHRHIVYFTHLNLAFIFSFKKMRRPIIDLQQIHTDKHTHART